MPKLEFHAIGLDQGQRVYLSQIFADSIEEAKELTEVSLDRKGMRDLYFCWIKNDKELVLFHPSKYPELKAKVKTMGGNSAELRNLWRNLHNGEYVNLWHLSDKEWLSIRRMAQRRIWDTVGHKEEC